MIRAIAACAIVMAAAVQQAAGAEPAARGLFGAVGKAAAMPQSAIGSYAKGCLAGGAMLPTEGPRWQAVRLSRNRNWGHSAMIGFLEEFAGKLPGINGWPGLLVGDISQPRGGPMRTGHASHQIGLDADVWLTPMPDRRLSRTEREEMSATNLVRPDKRDVDPLAYTPAHLALLKSVSKEAEVARIFVNPAIKRALCRDAGPDRAWLSKIRPMFGHNYHFHIRLWCPNGDEGCGNQEPPAPGDGCGAELDGWFTEAMLHPKPGGKPRPPMLMAQLPPECRKVLVAK